MPTTNSQNKKMLELEFGSGNPSVHYIGISLSNPLNTGLGVIEPSIAYGYSRVAVTNSKANWTDYINGQITNKTIIQFPQIVDSNWNTLEQPFFWFIATSQNGIGDDIKFYKEVSGVDKQLFDVGKLARLPVGSLKISVGL